MPERHRKSREAVKGYMQKALLTQLDMLSELRSLQGPNQITRPKNAAERQQHLRRLELESEERQIECNIRQLERSINRRTGDKGARVD